MFSGWCLFLCLFRLHRVHLMNLSRPQPVERVPRRRNNIAIVVAGRQPRSDSQLSYEQVNYRESSPANRECNYSVSRVQVGILRR
ncbi:hypothetical protein CMEL01_04323 [Colletotrichum melonis]|uniref:Secreted protein n=1 Tax=Colletotrichum melonis TaxID=1209925 RepID=A0AAI9UBZ5_9PEZI|nr:hypothetical protein CMEL01_04323 [Colletotrichum melonis]